MTLPDSVQEIADVIGREAALLLIGQLPSHAGTSGGARVILYVPKKLKPNHRLVQILGQERAEALVEGFGGEILKPANCNEVYRRFRDAEVRRLANDNGMTSSALAVLMGVSERTITNLTRAISPEERPSANDNTRVD